MLCSAPLCSRIAWHPWGAPVGGSYTVLQRSARVPPSVQRHTAAACGCNAHAATCARVRAWWCAAGFARDATHSSVAELSQYVTTRWYRAPEVIVRGDYGTAVDIWAFGE